MSNVGEEIYERCIYYELRSAASGCATCNLQMYFSFPPMHCMQIRALEVECQGIMVLVLVMMFLCEVNYAYKEPKR